MRNLEGKDQQTEQSARKDEKTEAELFQKPEKQARETQKNCRAESPKMEKRGVMNPSPNTTEPRESEAKNLRPGGQA